MTYVLTLHPDDDVAVALRALPPSASVPPANGWASARTSSCPGSSAR
jgi:hypothetical protein